MFGKYNWQQHGTEAMGNNPPMPVYRCEIGRDENGDMWLCEVKFRMNRDGDGKFIVRFDRDVLTDDGCPFLRGNVVDLENPSDYWEAMRTYHMMQICSYGDIQKCISKVVEKKNLSL